MRYCKSCDAMLPPQWWSHAELAHRLTPACFLVIWQDLPKLLTVTEALQASGAQHVAGHLVDLGGGSIKPDPLYEGECRYIVADAADDDRIGVYNCGQFANDLAIVPVDGDGGLAVREGGAYADVADEVNLLAIKHQLKLDDGVLSPLAPRFTLRRSVSFANEAPMELGVAYGEQFWREALRLGAE